MIKRVGAEALETSPVYMCAQQDKYNASTTLKEKSYSHALFFSWFITYF